VIKTACSRYHHQNALYFILRRLFVPSENSCSAVPETGEETIEPEQASPINIIKKIRAALSQSARLRFAPEGDAFLSISGSYARTKMNFTAMGLSPDVLSRSGGFDAVARSRLD